MRTVDKLTDYMGADIVTAPGRLDGARRLCYTGVGRLPPSDITRGRVSHLSQRYHYTMGVIDCPDRPPHLIR